MRRPKSYGWEVRNDLARREQTGRNLMIAREALGKTRSDWLIEYGISPSKLSQWESGLNFPNLNFLILLCDQYELSLDFFYRGVRAGCASSLDEDLATLTSEKPAAPPAGVVPAGAIERRTFFDGYSWIEITGAADGRTLSRRI